MGSRGRSGAGRAVGAPGRRETSRAPRGDLAARRERLREVIGPVVTAAGYDLEDLTVSRAGSRHVVRVMVDGDAGVSLDDVADISRAVSAALDAAESAGGELIEGQYQLEVGSPGVDRPLTQPRHWRRNVGRLVTVRAGDRQLTGRILAADNDGIVLDVGGERHGAAYAQLGPGRVQIEFSRLDELTDDDLDTDAGDGDEHDGGSDDEELEDEER
ncbi:MAG TPA: ribosome maturation factor RimP [Pilimelia sp.]|nr:ribosome maturation factor RimP [Pilimelia sp.]